jgi:6-phosphofructokinase 1
MAVQALLNGESDKMVTLIRHCDPVYHSTTGLVELAKVANVQRFLPDEYLDESKTMVTQAFKDYAQPLIGGPVPQYTMLEHIKVRKMR